MKMKVATILAVLALVSSCYRMPEAGVPYELAAQRSRNISDLRYDVRMDLTDEVGKVASDETLSLELSGKTPLAIDFRAGLENLRSVDVNSKYNVDVRWDGEHIVIPKRYLRKGQNRVSIHFTAGEQSLNRRDGFLYTLLVPDRCRTLIPCFDQPDLKARFSLSLNVPVDWTAVSNSRMTYRSRKDSVLMVSFDETEPLPTYLFSFAAGRFECDSLERGGSVIHLYHRETDPAKVAQCGEVLRLVSASLDWLEDYTGMAYPFSKYDLVVLPDFQYGGMEHTGATLYNDRRIFLGPRPTTDELLSRASLIAHETAHMWFGDCVTMRWFDDVWTKEVFANYMASKIVAPLYPEIDMHLGDMRSYWAAAYREDRTPGSNAIERPLPNLNKAGLIYCAIIYDKAPIVMGMLESRLGEERFREGVRTYLSRYAYGNADWDGLVDCFPQVEGFDIAEWSRVWVKEKGMPVYTSTLCNGRLEVVQSDPFAGGNCWPQEIVWQLLDCEGNPLERVTLPMDGERDSLSVSPSARYALPNADGFGYGCFLVDDMTADAMMALYPKSEPRLRMSILMTLYENVLRGGIAPHTFVDWVADVLPGETSGIVSNTLLDDAASVAERAGICERLEPILLSTASAKSAGYELRILSFRTLYRICRTPETIDLVYDAWKTRTPLGGLSLGENDYSSMATQLMIRRPSEADAIRSEQLSRISNPDRRATFEYVSLAASPDKAVRDSLFADMIAGPGRENESRCRSALALLTHPLREDALSRVVPALDILPDVQREGDIFFPQNWCAALLGGQRNHATDSTVRAWLASSPELDPLLRVKVLQQL